MRDLTGQRFHCLVVVEYDTSPGGSGWFCKCDCGKEAYAKAYDLMNGKKKSCGHLRTEHNKAYAERMKKTKNLMRVPQTFARFSDNWSIDDSLDELQGLT